MVTRILDPRLKNQHFKNHQDLKKLKTQFEDLAEKFCDEFGVGFDDEDSYSSSNDDTDWTQRIFKKKKYRMCPLKLSITLRNL